MASAGTCASSRRLGESLLPNQTCFFYSQLEFIDSQELLWGVEPEFF